MKRRYRILFRLDYYVHSVLDVIGTPMPRNKEKFNRLVRRRSDADR
jgi:hypothetical protein